ncbi:MAG: peptide-methionine (R)-S-oxide reductase [Pseudomonadota bacterium]|jgi:peptide-methionine (R)-S-oxide reductase
MHSMTRRGLLGLTAGLAGSLAGLRGTIAAEGTFEIMKTPEEWRTILSPMAYRVLREEDTERAFTSTLNDEKRAGTYHCAGCDLPLYSSKAKYDSGTGWPSFWEPLPNAVATKPDWGILGKRTEVHCRRCGGHLGHVFNDGPEPTGKRYCMNGVSLSFRAA